MFDFLYEQQFSSESEFRKKHFLAKRPIQGNASFKMTFKLMCVRPVTTSMYNKSSPLVKKDFQKQKKPVLYGINIGNCEINYLIFYSEFVDFL